MTTTTQIADTITRLSAALAEAEATIASLNARISTRGALDADPLEMAARLLGSSAPLDTNAEELRSALTRRDQLAQAVRATRIEQERIQRAEAREIREAGAPARKKARADVLKAADALADALAAADKVDADLAAAGADLDGMPRGLGCPDQDGRWSIAATAGEIREFIASEYREAARARLLTAAPSPRMVRCRLHCGVAGHAAGAVVDLPEHVAALAVFDGHAVQTTDPLASAPRPVGAVHCW